MKTQGSGRYRFIISALLSALLLYAQTAFGISGDRWLKLSKDNRVVYIGGGLDAWDHDVALCAKSKSEDPWCAHVKTTYEPIIACSNDRPYTEIFAIVEKYMKDHAEELEGPMARQLWAALHQSCQKNTRRQSREAPNDLDADESNADAVGE